MHHSTHLRTAAATAIVLAAIVVPARAQITTGSVAGTVKDVQGGVIPGATVTLISETRGTRSTPVVTNYDGDFIFPSVAGDAYTVLVEMSGFKTLRRSGIAVSPGSRVTLGTLTLDVGGTAEVVLVKGEAPLIRAIRDPGCGLRIPARRVRLSRTLKKSKARGNISL